MFKSIRWRFIIIYFLLVFLAMAIVGFFITDQIEKIQLKTASDSMTAHIDSILVSSTALKSDDWEKSQSYIKESISGSIQIGYNENVYIIANNDNKTIIAGSVQDTIGISAYVSKKVNNRLLVDALKEKTVKKEIPPEGLDGVTSKVYHMARPVKDSDGNIKGIIYLTDNLDYVYDTVEETRAMLTRATMIALIITIVLGFFIARSITVPIKDLTLKAKEMSKGDFNQYVEVKSSDEIGQLGNMFNYLTKELKKNISEVHQEKSKMETTFNYMADGVIAVDIGGQIIHANFIAKKVLDIPENNNSYNNLMLNINEVLTLDQMKENNWEGSQITEIKGDTYKINYAPFKNDRNEIGGVILVIQNITEQHKLEKMRKEFVANVSHELKTPITTIKSYTETLLGGALGDKDIAEEFLNVINSESDRMSRLVSDLLKLSRMDYEQTNWNMIKVDVNEIIEEVYKKLKLSAEIKEVSMEIEIMEDLPNVLFDRDGLEQINLNIISNAIKYTPRNGKIEIKTYKTNDKVIISVKDTGIGIPKKEIDRIFERFYRVDKARTRDLGGTGLGLSIAKHIADAHGASIEVESELNKGTEVKVVIAMY